LTWRITFTHTKAYQHIRPLDGFSIKNFYEVIPPILWKWIVVQRFETTFQTGKPERLKVPPPRMRILLGLPCLDQLPLPLVLKVVHCRLFSSLLSCWLLAKHFKSAERRKGE
jgi:hypothetical protein